MNIDFAQKASSSQESVLQALQEAPVKHVDESSLRIGNKTMWFHVISNDQFTHYRVASRGNILPNVVGHCIHDHFKAYFTKMDKAVHALCNAHHLRELQGLEEIEQESWASKMSRLLKLSCSLKKREKSPPYLDRIFSMYDRILAEGFGLHESKPALDSKRKKRRKGHNLLIRLRDFKDAVLRFLTVPEVPFTNNQAEQDIRVSSLNKRFLEALEHHMGRITFVLSEAFSQLPGKSNKISCRLFTLSLRGYLSSYLR